jgi:type VI secretion system protein ImpI
MILTLEVTGPQAERLGAASRKVFRDAGGSIGRLPRNDWSLPDPYVSSRHALIRFRDGAFFIEDTSTNGISLNRPDNRLVKGVPQPLQSGDWIFIEPYEIRVSIEDAESTAAASPFDDLFGSPAPPAPVASPMPAAPDPFAGGAGAFGSSPAPPPPPFEPIQPGEQVDPLALLGFGPSSEPPPAPRAADLAGGSVLSDSYRPPPPVTEAPRPVAKGPDFIPDDWLNPAPPPVPAPPAPAREPMAHEPPAPARPQPPPRHPVPPPATGGAPPRPAPGGSRSRTGGASIDFRQVLGGAGLGDAPVTPELARDFGRILRVVVAGVIDVMEARRRIKREFRLGVTELKPADNNPLKFSVNVDDALHNLLVKRNAAFLGPVEAFEDAFEDVRNHQIAMLQALRVAFDAMLAEFDPERLQEEFDQRAKGAIVSVPAKMRYWDQYRDRFHGMVRDPDASFRKLFGDEFASAYEEQLGRLRARGRQP